MGDHDVPGRSPDLRVITVRLTFPDNVQWSP